MTQFHGAIDGVEDAIPHQILCSSKGSLHSARKTSPFISKEKHRSTNSEKDTAQFSILLSIAFCV